MECTSEAAAGAAMRLLQARYALPVVQALLGGPLRFNALQRAVRVPSSSTLRVRLRELVAAGVVERVADSYRLTPAGGRLRPVFEALAAFTLAHPQHDPQLILALLQRRHALPVMRELRAGAVGFNDLQRAVAAPSATTLTRRLQELEQWGLIVRISGPDLPQRLKYAHSPLGEHFSPVVGQIVVWGREALMAGLSR